PRPEPLVQLGTVEEPPLVVEVHVDVVEPARVGVPDDPGDDQVALGRRLTPVGLGLDLDDAAPVAEAGGADAGDVVAGGRAPQLEVDEVGGRCAGARRQQGDARGDGRRNSGRAGRSGYQPRRSTGHRSTTSPPCATWSTSWYATVGSTWAGRTRTRSPTRWVV